jgi:hypothetical protein
MMKNLLLIGSVCILHFSSLSQNVPNGDFEQWDTNNNFIIDNYIFYGQVNRTEDAYEGSYALRLNNYGDENGPYYASSLYNIDWAAPSNLDKFAFSGDVLSMVFQSKYNLAPGDSAYIYASFWEKGDFKGDVNIYVTGNSNDQFVKFNSPITWNSARTPDSVFIGMRSKIGNGAPLGEGFMIVDDLHFENIGYRPEEIVNHGFEQWTNNGVRYPRYWNTIDYHATKHWGGFLQNPSVVENTNAYSGFGCLELNVFENWGSLSNSWAFHENAKDQSWRPAFAVSEGYKYLQGFYQYTSDANDTGNIELNMFKDGSYYGEGEIQFAPSTTGWTFFSFPITYYNDTFPDSCVIRINATSTTPQSGNTKLLIDNLKLINSPNSASTKSLKNNSILLYPNPTRSEFKIVANFSVDSYEIYNVLGSKVQTGISKKVNISDLESGTYTVHIIGSNSRLTSKIIKL